MDAELAKFIFDEAESIHVRCELVEDYSINGCEPTTGLVFWSVNDLLRAVVRVSVASALNDNFWVTPRNGFYENVSMHGMEIEHEMEIEHAMENIRAAPHGHDATLYY